jgi:hypothetical protein
MLVSSMTAPWERLQPLAWAGGIVLLARVPAVTGHVPILSLFAGSMAWVVLGLAAAMVLAAGVPAGAAARIGAPWLFGASALLSATMGLHYIAHLQATGDEPEYLLMAQSLWKEHDLDLADNWKRGDFKEYVPGMERMPQGTFRKDGRPISSHSPGLPALLAPVYALGGRRLCVLLFALGAATLALAVRALALRLTGDPAAALLAWAATAGPPVLYYSFHLYTELPSTLAAALSLCLLLKPARDGERASPGTGAAVLSALLISFLPWLHVKLTVLAAVLGLLALWRLRGRPLVAFLAIALVMAAGFVAYNLHVFGTLTSIGLYGNHVPVAVRYAVPGRALFGLFLDRNFGLLPYAPVFLLGFAGLFVLPPRSWRDWLPYLAYAIAVLVPVLSWRVWFAGFCPPARFVVPLVPCLGVSLAARVAGRRYGLARWALPLVLIGYVWTALAIRVPGALFLLHAKYDAPRLFEQLTSTDFVFRYLPTLTFLGDAEVRVTVVWCVVAGLLLLLDRLAERYAAADRLFRSPALPLALLLLAGLAIDHWARAPSTGALSYGQVSRLAAGA